MERFFGISYCFDKQEIYSVLDNVIRNDQSGYVCVADGVTLATSHQDAYLSSILDQSLLNVCDSGWVPLYLKSLYGIDREQYSGSDFLMDIVRSGKYKMMFLGSSEEVLSALKQRLTTINPTVDAMRFEALPFREIDNFDYPEIAHDINREQPDIVFVSLGMPKQEQFMHRLQPHISRGILIGVGAAFKFHSGLPDQKRAPRWMIKAKMEWVHRIYSEPKKQIGRCLLIVKTMPLIYREEYKRKKKQHEY